MPSTRRQFTLALAAGAAAPFALGQDGPPSELGTSLAKLIEAQHGSHLSAGELQRVARDMQRHAGLLERLRAFELKNADEPDFTFVASLERW
jgi:hypothetical protein